MGVRIGSPPELQHGVSTKPGTGTPTLELADEDIDPLPKGDDSSLPPGTILADKYLIEGQIGRGGIGVIVAAKHLHLDQRVAIKYLQKKVLGNLTIIERFAREARLAAQIKSDHVVRVHDVAADENLGPYIVMEYLEGNDLGKLLDPGPLPIADAVDYVLQACDALAEAHSLGIVHRDLKPDNLFLAKRPAGRSIVKILDFGISKSAPAQRGSGGWSHVTTASETFGTPVYMSPEQLRSSASVDARSDIWALGVVLFELLTRQFPFVGDSVAQLCTSILSDPPRALRSLRPEAPAGLEETVLRCLEKNVARRFRNVAELAQGLAPFGLVGSDTRVQHITRVVEEGGESVRPSAPLNAPVASKTTTLFESDANVPGVPKRRSSGVLAYAAAGGLFAIVVLVVAMASLGRTASDPTRTAIPVAPAVAAAPPAPSPTSSPTPAWTATPTPTPTPTPTSTSTSTPTVRPPRGAAPALAKSSTPPSPAAPPVPTVSPTPSAKPTHHDDYNQFGERP